MKNVAVINSCDWGSTGKIALNLFMRLSYRGFTSYFFYGRGNRSSDSRVIKFETDFEVIVHYVLATVLGLQGFFSYFATKRLVKQLDKNNIDTVFLLSPHGYYLNERVLFSHLSKRSIFLIYIMIDEYPYLGKCTNEPECKTYITGRGKCPNIRKYPKSLLFNTCPLVLCSKKNNYWKLKDNVVFVGPEYVVESSKRSFLGAYMSPVALDEAIDINLYHPVDTTVFRKDMGIAEDAIIFLCVAPSHKGVEFFVDLARRYRDVHNYVFIHIGSSTFDVKQDNYIQIDFVKENTDLVKFYSMADLFVFTSLADTMSNTCLEALACGTPLLVFNISGMPYLLDETVGSIVPPRDVDAMARIIDKTGKKVDKIVKRCRSYAERRYDGNSYADKLIQIAIEK